MYKVFIENTSLHIVEKKDFIPTNAIVIHIEGLNLIKSKLLKLIQFTENELDVYFVCDSAENVFQLLFEDYEFIEAAGGIVKRKDQYLFIKRNGYWDIPKGKLEIGELPEVGAVREIEEECGINNPLIDQFICETFHTYLFKGRPTIKKTYWYSLSYGGPKKVTAQLEEGITKVKWFNESEIPKIRKNTFASILDVIYRYFEKEKHD